MVMTRFLPVFAIVLASCGAAPPATLPPPDPAAVKVFQDPQAPLEDRVEALLS